MVDGFLMKYSYSLMIFALWIMAFIGLQKLMPPVPVEYAEIFFSINSALAVVGIVCLIGYFKGTHLSKLNASKQKTKE